MNRLEKFERIDELGLKIESLEKPNCDEIARHYIGTVGLEVATVTNQRVTFSFLEAQDSFPRDYDQIFNIASKLEKSEHFVTGLQTPELHQIFLDAVTKIVNKVTDIHHAATRVGNAPNMENKDIAKIHRRYEGNSLYDKELENARELKHLRDERSQLAFELGVVRKKGNRKLQQPDPVKLKRAHRMEKIMSKEEQKHLTP